MPRRHVTILFLVGMATASGAFLIPSAAENSAEADVVNAVQPLLSERRFAEALAYLDGHRPGLEQAGDARALLALHYFRGVCRYHLAEFSLAREAWEEALRFAAALGDHAREQSLHGNASLACQQTDDFVCAEEHALHALRLAEARSDVGGVVGGLNSLGNIHRQRGEGAKAIALFERALRMAEESGDLRRTSEALSNLALMLPSQGRYEESLAFHARSMEISKRLGHEAGLARSHNNIGIIHRVTSRYDEALRHFHEARRINERMGDKAGLALALYNIAFVHSTLGEYEKAVPLYEKTLRLQEEMGQKIPASMTRVSMAMLHLDRDEFAEAEMLARQAVEIYEVLKAHADRARALIQMGRALDGQGKKRDAVRALEEAARLCREGNHNVYALNWALVHLSALYAERGLRKKAVETAEEALAVERAPDGRRRAHAALAEAYRRARRVEDATFHYREALAVVEDVRSTLYEKGQRMSFLEKQIALYEDYVDFLMTMGGEMRGGKRRAGGNASEIFTTAERMKARTFLEDLGAARFVREGIAPDLVKAKIDLEAQIRDLRKRAERE